ncbi:putative nitrogen fixation protein NifT [Synechococcus sp. PCC 7335]|uniref:putative nitrogen fixation protein NifT n=1 Tax=Synechococcus sp. (strain ATCC 29403 / PCC 7335) TaxID=91464 RepID=UPI00056F988F|nr:putative nitrogen fixation protein NifT [Synechococcus sp. PCC 7335]
MKVMLHTDRAGKLMAYVAKKDLEQEVTQKARADEDHVLTLANGWELQIAGLDDPIQTPQTVRAKRVK